jgi:CubicO group peptidase (beta-lactamase class C family)
MKSPIAVILTLTVVCSFETGHAQGLKKDIDIFIEQKMNEAGIVGLGAAIIDNQTMLWAQGYGFSDKHREVPFAPTTIMNSAGISKTITGFCLMKAVEENKVSLDEDINKYLPFKVINPFFPNDVITLRQLATHSACIADQSELYNSTYTYGVDSPEQLGDFLKNYFDPSERYYKKENFLDKKPGTFFRYSNIATGLAAYIVEMATAEKLNEYSKRVLFDPLKMNNTGWLLSEVDTAKHSHLYKAEQDTITEFELYGITTYPDGGLRTSVAELSKFLIGLVNEGEYNGTRILKRELALEMIKPQFTSQNKPLNMDLTKKNYGVFIPLWRAENRMGNAGGDFGVINKMFYDPTKKIGVLLFANTSLSEEGNKRFDLIFEELWKYALVLKKNKNDVH